MKIDVLSNGRLQLTDNGQVYPPLTVDEVEALANAVPAAQGVLDGYPLGSAIDDIAYGLKELATPSATVDFSDGLVTVTTADADTFAALADGMDVVLAPGATSFAKGPATVTQTGA